MPTLNIADFSCLKSAVFDVAPVNVIIGPQGSGKSVTIKLFYFFTDIISTYLQSAERGETLDEYKRNLAKQFTIWFPPSAWGVGRFNISYSAGDFFVRVLRRKVGGRLSGEVALTFSDWFADLYDSARDQFTRVRNASDVKKKEDVRVSDDFDRLWRVRDIMTNRVSGTLAKEYFAQQTFIPAGRAFFTSIGRLMAGIEQAGSIDPLTIKFARLLANLRDRRPDFFPMSVETETELSGRRNLFMTRLFGGELKNEGDAEFVETSDGRKIPFSSLSSGQQELLPMWVLMDYFLQADAFRRTRRQRSDRSPRDLIYIEEPEAHLFPSAQSVLMDFLVGSVESERSERCLIFTTHSPYIMSKLNVFLKAGQLARRKKKNQEINDVVPRDCWLNDKQLSALAIEDGSLRSLIDSDGLIDGTYLDEVSEEISRQFSRLLKIESEM